MPWTKEPAWAGPVHIGCLNCSPVPANTPACRLDRTLAVGFGSVQVRKDGTCVYDEQEWIYTQYQQHGLKDPSLMTDEELDAAMEISGATDLEDYPTLATYEAEAVLDPDHDWRVLFYGAMHEEEYQRQDVGSWVLIRSGMGFA